MSFLSSVVSVKCRFDQVWFRSSVISIKCRFDQVSFRSNIVSIKCHSIKCRSINCRVTLPFRALLRRFLEIGLVPSFSLLHAKAITGCCRPTYKCTSNSCKFLSQSFFSKTSTNDLLLLNYENKFIIIFLFSKL